MCCLEAKFSFVHGVYVAKQHVHAARGGRRGEEGGGERREERGGRREEGGVRKERSKKIGRRGGDKWRWG